MCNPSRESFFISCVDKSDLEGNSGILLIARFTLIMYTNTYDTYEASVKKAEYFTH